MRIVCVLAIVMAATLCADATLLSLVDEWQFYAPFEWNDVAPAESCISPEERLVYYEDSYDHDAACKEWASDPNS
jgi:hypothetical protein